MGKALCEAFPEAKAVFDAADDALGAGLSKLCFEGPEEELKLTQNTQPAILTMSIAVHAVFAKRLMQAPAFMAGHSLGEYSALVAAGALSLPDAVRVVRARGQFMQDAVPQGQGAMAAVLGLEGDAVRAICAAVAGDQVVAPANFNELTQTVIAGHAEAVERATVKLKEAGAKRVLPLGVSAPFHCSLMEPVVSRLAAVLETISIKAPHTPVIANVDAQPNSEAGRVVPLLLTQVTSSVRWVECVQTLEKNGVTHVFELGPGKVLCGLVKRIAPTIATAAIDDPVTLEKALAGGTP